MKIGTNLIDKISPNLVVKTPFIYTIAFYENGYPKIRRETRFDKFISISNNNGVKFNFKKPIYIHNREINSYNVISFLDLNISFFNEDFDEQKMIQIFIKHLIDELSLKQDKIHKELISLKEYLL
jgi:hypothetical protein